MEDIWRSFRIDQIGGQWRTVNQIGGHGGLCGHHVTIATVVLRLEMLTRFCSVFNVVCDVYVCSRLVNQYKLVKLVQTGTTLQAGTN